MGKIIDFDKSFITIGLRASIMIALLIVSALAAFWCRDTPHLGTACIVLVLSAALVQPGQYVGNIAVVLCAIIAIALLDRSGLVTGLAPAKVKVTGEYLFLVTGRGLLRLFVVVVSVGAVSLFAGYKAT